MTSFRIRAVRFALDDPAESRWRTLLRKEKWLKLFVLYTLFVSLGGGGLLVLYTLTGRDVGEAFGLGLRGQWVLLSLIFVLSVAAITYGLRVEREISDLDRHSMIYIDTRSAAGLGSDWRENDQRFALVSALGAVPLPEQFNSPEHHLLREALSNGSI